MLLWIRPVCTVKTKQFVLIQGSSEWAPLEAISKQVRTHCRLQVVLSSWGDVWGFCPSWALCCCVTCSWTKQAVFFDPLAALWAEPSSKEGSCLQQWYSITGGILLQQPWGDGSLKGLQRYFWDIQGGVSYAKGPNLRPAGKLGGAQTQEEWWDELRMETGELSKLWLKLSLMLYVRGSLSMFEKGSNSLVAFLRGTRSS